MRTSSKKGNKSGSSTSTKVAKPTSMKYAGVASNEGSVELVTSTSRGKRDNSGELEGGNEDF